MKSNALQKPKPIDAEGFDRLARTVFRPVYPVIAGQIIQRTGITQGPCMDVGCAGGYLGLAMMAQSDVSVHFLDASKEMLSVARRNAVEQDVSNRAAFVHGDVTDIPLPDETFCLAISRGSAFFWQRLSRAFSEIQRILRPDGTAYIGGGFGTAALQEAISREMETSNKGAGNWRKKVSRNLGDEMRERFEKALSSAGITAFDIIHNQEVGLWIVFQK